MATSRRQPVIDRAGNCCEYCRMPQQSTSLPLELDHIRSQNYAGTPYSTTFAWPARHVTNQRPPVSPPHSGTSNSTLSPGIDPQPAIESGQLMFQTSMPESRV